MLAASGVINSLTDWLDRVSGHWWFLAIILVIALLDSVIPIVPSETTVIIGGVAASSAGLAPYNIMFVIIAGALGAFIGDNLSYQIGRRASRLVERRAAKKESTAKKLKWAADQIEERGGLLLITARFIPGGRTVLTLSSGLTKQSQSWFMGWVGVATVIWASYAAILGYSFGTKFENDHTKAFIVAFAAALAVTFAIELVRFVKKKLTSKATQETAV